MKQGIGHEIFRTAVYVAEMFRTAVRLPVRGFLGTEPLGNPTLGLRECFRLLGSPTSPYSTALVDMFVRLAALLNKPVYDDIFYISSYIALALNYLHFLLVVSFLTQNAS